MLKKTGIAALADFLGSKASNNTSYKRMTIPSWEINENEYLLIHNVQIVDVKLGKIRRENGLLVKNQRIEALVMKSELNQVRNNFHIKKEIDGGNKYIIPGMSDIHAHLTLISEFDFKIKNLRYFDNQREKNCEEAIKHGCTFVKDSGGAARVIDYLKEEIKQNRLIGPRIMAAKEVVSPKGGMWDLGLANHFSSVIFGGRLLNFPANRKQLEKVLDRTIDLGCDFIKIYLEDKPLYGGKESDVYTMFSSEEIDIIKHKAAGASKMVEAHSMFIKGSRRAIEAGLDMIAHITVDEPYTDEDARKMKAGNVSIVPTLSLGCYLAMNMGDKGFPYHQDFLFFQEMLKQYIPNMIDESVIPELKGSYCKFYDWIIEEILERRMPQIGKVYPERVHGFAKNARESIQNLMNHGVKIGIGTDGGTGITFTGNLQVEFEAFHHFGFTPVEILRMATLGNMEILHLEKDMGSIEIGKFADLVILEDNPLSNIHAISKINCVIKGGQPQIFYTKS
ncbi:MAG: amidohydrolase family protein [Clostridiales bacterium]|nr:amidohydrolase family protein [Clostridiales bacterium]